MPIKLTKNPDMALEAWSGWSLHNLTYQLHTSALTMAGYDVLLAGASEKGTSDYAVILQHKVDGTFAVQRGNQWYDTIEFRPVILKTVADLRKWVNDQYKNKGLLYWHEDKVETLLKELEGVSSDAREGTPVS